MEAIMESTYVKCTGYVLNMYSAVHVCTKIGPSTGIVLCGGAAEALAEAVGPRGEQIELRGAHSSSHGHTP